MAGEEKIFNSDGTNNIGDIVSENILQSQSGPDESIVQSSSLEIPFEKPSAPIDSYFKTGDFTDEYLRNKDAAAEMDKAFNAEFPDKPSTGMLPNSAYYPGMDDPILKGMSSSKTLGSQPVFVRSGGFFPFGILDARQKSVEEAAKQRALQQRAFDVPKKPLVKDPRFQETLNQNFERDLQSIIGEAKTIYGDKALYVLQNRKDDPLAVKMRTMLDNYDVLARETDQVTDTIAGIKKGIEDKTMSYSPETRELVNNYEKLISEFEGGKVDVSLRKNLNELKGSQAIDVYLNKYLYPQMEAEVNEAWGQFQSEGDLNVARQSMRTTYKNLARKWAKQAKQDQYADQSWISEDDIYNRILSTKGDKLESDLKAMNKPSERLAGYDAQNKKEVNVQDHKSFVYTDPTTGENKTSVAFKNWVDTKPSKTAKPLKITGGTYFSVGDNSGEFGKTINRNRNEVLEITPTGFGDAVIQGQNQQVIVGTVKSKRQAKDEKGNPLTDGSGQPKMEEFSETIMMPMHQNEAEIRNNMPNLYDVFQENSSVTIKDQGIKGTKQTTKGVDITNLYD